MEKAILLAKAYEMAHKYTNDTSDIQMYTERYYKVMLEIAEKFDVFAPAVNIENRNWKELK